MTKEPTVFTVNFQTDRPEKTVYTHIRCCRVVVWCKFLLQLLKGWPCNRWLLAGSKAGLHNLVGRASDCRSRNRKFESKLSHLKFVVEIEHDITFTVIPHPPPPPHLPSHPPTPIPSLPIIQEGKLSVTRERM